MLLGDDIRLTRFFRTGSSADPIGSRGDDSALGDEMVMVPSLRTRVTLGAISLPSRGMFGLRFGINCIYFIRLVPPLADDGVARQVRDEHHCELRIAVGAPGLPLPEIGPLLDLGQRAITDWRTVDLDRVEALQALRDRCDCGGATECLG